MAEETNVKIGIDIEIDKAEQKIEKLTQMIERLTEMDGGEGIYSQKIAQWTEEKERLVEYVNQAKEAAQNLSDEMNKNTSATESNTDATEKNAEANDKMSQATDRATTSAKKQVSGLNDVKDVTDFASQATGILVGKESQLGQAISSTTGLIGKAIIFIKNGAKAMDAMKASTNNATGAMNKFKAVLTSISKHPFLIALTAIAAAAALVYKRMKDFEQAGFEKRLGVIERVTELTNEKLENQVDILTALGAKQSTITKQQISNLEKLNERLSKTQEYYKEMWDSAGYGEDNYLPYMASEYLKGNEALIEKLDDNAKELVKRYAEAGEQIRKNNIRLETMRQITLQINLAEEKYNNTLKQININQQKASQSLSKDISRLETRLQYADRLEKYSIRRFKYEDELAKKENEQNRVNIKALNDQIDAMEDMRAAKSKLLKQSLLSGDEAAAAEIQAQMNEIAVQQKELQIKKEAELAQIQLRNESRTMNMYATVLDNVDKINELSLEIYNRYNEMATMRGLGVSSYLGVGEDNTIKSFYENMSQSYEQIGKIMSKFKEDVEDNYDFVDEVDKKGSTIVEKITDEITRLQKKAGDLNAEADDYAEKLKPIAERLQIMTGALEDYLVKSEEAAIQIRKIGIDVASTTQSAVQGFSDVISSIVPVGSISRGSDILSQYSEQLEEVIKSYEKAYSAAYYYSRGLEEQADAILKDDDVEKQLYKTLSEGGDSVAASVIEIVNQLITMSTEYSLQSKEVALRNQEMTMSYMQAYESLGKYRLSEMEKNEIAVVDAEKAYYDELLKVGGSYYQKLKDAGLSVTQIEEILGEKRVQIEQEVADKKLLINQNYKQRMLDAGADLAGNLNSITENMFSLEGDMSDENFERNKKLQGATLIASTYANAAQAFGSTYAQAPGGVAAKTIQAGIASAAVLASGIQAYNKLMATTKDTASISDYNNAQGQSFSPVETGTSSVVNTLVGGRYNRYQQDIQPVLVVDEVTFKQQQQQNLKRVATI